MSTMSAKLQAEEDKKSNYYKSAQEASTYIKSKVPVVPKILVICGSGLGVFCDYIEGPKELKYQDIPNVPVSSVQGHGNKLVHGHIKGVPVIAMQGRVHFYEGYDLKEIVFLIRALHLSGVKTLLVTSATGGVNTDFEVGDFMLIKDHINLCGLTGQNPLIGLNDEKFGTRFPIMSGAYDRELGALFVESAKELGYEKTIRKGVMTVVSGPTFETPAEIRMIRIIGGDTVGMSVGPEVIAARHCGMSVMGVNLVTNKCSGKSDEDDPTEFDASGVKLETLHDSVLQVANDSSERLSKIISLLITKIPKKYC